MSAQSKNCRGVLRELAHETYAVRQKSLSGDREEVTKVKQLFQSSMSISAFVKRLNHEQSIFINRMQRNLTIAKETEEMTAVNPYLNFSGNTEEAFNFYKSVFGGDFLAVMRFKDNPECGNIAESDKNRIMHIALPIGNGTTLMGTDSLESLGQKLTFGNNIYICLSPGTREEAERLFNGLSKDGKIEMPLQDMFWGAYFGSFTDKFGVQWMINQSKNAQ